MMEIMQFRPTTQLMLKWVNLEIFSALHTACWDYSLNGYSTFAIRRGHKGTKKHLCTSLLAQRCDVGSSGHRVIIMDELSYLVTKSSETKANETISHSIIHQRDVGGHILGSISAEQRNTTKRQLGPDSLIAL